MHEWHAPPQAGNGYIITVSTSDVTRLRRTTSFARTRGGEGVAAAFRPSQPPTWPPPGTCGGLGLNDTRAGPGPLRPKKRALDYSEPPEYTFEDHMLNKYLNAD